MIGLGAKGLSMEYWEFCELTEQMAAQLLPRVPAAHQRIFDPEEWGGEYSYMLESMVWVVVENKVPISAQELATLRSLAAYYKGGEELLVDLKQVKPT
jgi:N-acetyl-beta-hexosaminidase